jgi:hypothetical protein
LLKKMTTKLVLSHGPSRDDLLNVVTPKIAKRDTSMLQEVTPSQRLCISLRRLAPGNTSGT